ncbi:MAG: response regulator transcription factor [Spirochaetota bacterium]
MNKKIFIVDDHPVFRYGLSQLIGREIGLEVCGEAENAQKALQLIRKLKPDLVIVDIGLDGPSGLELTKDIVAFGMNIPVLIVSMYDESIYAERALRLGARGYVMKQQTYENVITAIRKILNGGIYLSEQMSEKIINKAISGIANNSENLLSILTNREIEVLRLIGSGKSVREISQALNLSINTINTYRERIKNKLNLKNNFELQKYAIRAIDTKLI